MQRLLILGLILILVACGPSNIKANHGVIQEVRQVPCGETYIKVSFKIHGYNYTEKLWFLGSDTCKVGQVVKLY